MVSILSNDLGFKAPVLLSLAMVLMMMMAVIARVITRLSSDRDFGHDGAQQC